MLGLLHFFQSSCIKIMLFFKWNCEEEHAQLENYSKLPDETKPSILWGNQRIGILIFWLLLIINSKSPDAGYKQVAPAKTVPHSGVFSSLPACHAVALAAEVATSWRGSRAHLRCEAGLTCAALLPAQSIFPFSPKITAPCLSSPLMHFAFTHSLSSSGSFIQGSLAH